MKKIINFFKKLFGFCCECKNEEKDDLEDNFQDDLEAYVQERAKRELDLIKLIEQAEQKRNK